MLQRLGHFVNASVVSLVFLLPPSPFPVSSVYIIYKKMFNNAIFTKKKLQ